jgi:hypothetical protein
LNTFSKTLLLVLVFSLSLSAECKVPTALQDFVSRSSLSALSQYKDVQRNKKILQNLCLYKVAFTEGKYKWKMLLVLHPKQPKSMLWFLPHDDENTAFDTAVYATQKYGGGFLSILSNNKRSFMGQDPNRNFGTEQKTSKHCKGQKYPAPKYTSIIFKIIDTYKPKHLPYLSLHTNKDGYWGNQGSGGVSILKSSSMVQSYKAFSDIDRKSTGLKDEDSLVYIAGVTRKPPVKKLQRLLNNGINTRYEVVNPSSNDCSLSNYVLLEKNTNRYYNLEVEDGDFSTHKKMLDIMVTLF